MRRSYASGGRCLSISSTALSPLAACYRLSRSKHTYLKNLTVILHALAVSNIK